MKTIPSNSVPYGLIEESIIDFINDHAIFQPATEQLRQRVQDEIDSIFRRVEDRGETVVDNNGDVVSGVRFYFSGGSQCSLEVQYRDGQPSGLVDVEIDATEQDVIELTKTDKSILLYAESCMVDYGGLLEGQRMNGEDIESLNKLRDAGILDYGRIPGRLMGKLPTERNVSYWVTLTDAGWLMSAQLRRERFRVTTARKAVDDALAAREAGE